MKTITYNESMAIEHLIWMAHRKSEEVDEIIGNMTAKELIKILGLKVEKRK